MNENTINTLRLRYAYETSPWAMRYNAGRGCYLLTDETDRRIAGPFDNSADALEWADGAGHQVDQWDLAMLAGGNVRE